MTSEQLDERRDARRDPRHRAFADPGTASDPGHPARAARHSIDKARASTRPAMAPGRSSEVAVYFSALESTQNACKHHAPGANHGRRCGRNSSDRFAVVDGNTASVRRRLGRTAGSQASPTAWRRRAALSWSLGTRRHGSAAPLRRALASPKSVAAALQGNVVQLSRSGARRTRSYGRRLLVQSAPSHRPRTSTRTGTSHGGDLPRAAKRCTCARLCRHGSTTVSRQSAPCSSSRIHFRLNAG